MFHGSERRKCSCRSSLVLLLGYKDDCKEPILKNKNLLGLRSTCDEPRLDQNQDQDLRNLLKVTRTCVCLYHVHIYICVRYTALPVAVPSIATKEDSIDDTTLEQYYRGRLFYPIITPHSTHAQDPTKLGVEVVDLGRASTCCENASQLAGPEVHCRRYTCWTHS